jgi:4-amino-4-deoxy-L-arabinose transferase-like glycosyltransferase
MKKIFYPLLVIMISVLIGLFFSYRILQTPPGITVDEAAFGYNAVLLEKTLHDENGRFLPFFVMSINGADWRQPVSQYYITAVFKIFGPSLLTLRLSTVAILIFSTFLTFFWLQKILNKKSAIIGTVIFLTTPLVMIQTHMALDNIFPIPFTLIWLICLWYYNKTKNLKYLLFAGISLGINFYTYKAMRATVPVWCVLTVISFFTEIKSQYSKNKIRKFVNESLFFSLGVFPFFAIIPVLEKKYPGAVFNSNGFNWSSVYDFLYPYISSFDLSFLFIKGDSTIFHSTGVHGMLLLASLPLFLIGIYQAFKKRGVWLFIIAVMFSTPLLFGFVNSVHRASRLMAFIPSFVALSTLGAATITENKNKFFSKIFTVVFVLLFIFNYADFVNYYWYTYPKFARASFMPSNEVAGAYEYLSKIAKKNNLTPHIEAGPRHSDGQTGNFLEAAYFDEPLILWQPDSHLPEKGIVMAKLEHQPNLKTVGDPIFGYYFFVNETESIINL